MAKNTNSPSSTPSLRPPIVTVMGHVDHGKTSLLDYIRKTRIADKEHGGITQHIGAYQAVIPGEKGTTKYVTFIDTPGHAAFEKMRSRGGQVADIVVLVIAANEGLKPQTEESLKHIQTAQVPFIVALNKSDLPDANPDLVKNQLAERGYLTEDRGGQIMAIPVSAHTGQGVPELLESLLLVAEMEELTADPNGALQAVVIESHRDPRRGPLATLIIQNGRLQARQEIHADRVGGKVKAMFDHLGKPVTEALPSTPVLILGWDDVPPVGSLIAAGPVGQIDPIPFRAVSPASQNNAASSFKVILKADTAGTLEALEHVVPAGVEILEKNLGAVNENDVLFAKTSNAQIISFNAEVPTRIVRSADTEGVTIQTFNIIYKLQEYLDDQLQRAIDPLYGKEILGQAEIRANFNINKQRIAGGKVISGEITSGGFILHSRNEQIIGSAKVANLQQGPQKVELVKKGNEFGATFSPYVDLQVGDVIIAYRDIKKA